MLADGCTTTGLADKLAFSCRTIETDCQHLLVKSKAQNVAALIQLTMAQDLLG